MQNHHHSRSLRASEQETQPLRRVAPLVHPAHASVQAYVACYQLSWMDVARAAGLLFIVVWRVTRCLPVSPAHAAALRSGLFRLTGVAYTGPMVTTAPEPRSALTRTDAIHAAPVGRR